MKQIARNMTDAWSGFLIGKEYLIHDRDALFTNDFTMILKSAGVKCKKLPPRSPQLNSFIESFIKSFRQECMDKLILTSEAQLRYVVREYLEYHNRERPHRGLGGEMINPWPQDPDGDIIEFSRLGGLLKSYRRVKQAA
ncbi:MAG: integrase core domain-containing protein [Victivallaceae bacterium]